MEKQESRLKKQETIEVYVCPFCLNSIWFDILEELAIHISHEHSTLVFHYVAGANKKTVMKTQKKWMVITKCK